MKIDEAIAYLSDKEYSMNHHNGYDMYVWFDDSGEIIAEADISQKRSTAVVHRNGTTSFFQGNDANGLQNTGKRRGVEVS